MLCKLRFGKVMSYNILIVEDDASFGQTLRNWAAKNEFNADLVTSVAQAKKNLSQSDYSLVLTDLRLPDGDGIMLLEWIREQKKAPPVIVMTGYGQVQSAVAAMKLGAFDYMQKPMNPTLLKEKIAQALSHKPAPTAPVSQPAAPVADIVYGKSGPSRKMYDDIAIIAPTRMSVIISGESGTGKEYAARMIHASSKRASAPFIAVDCGILSRELAPSELFGHIKGSFTSAIADKKGVFEQADGGTVFLDEVENLPYDVQIQLLRAIQERRVRPVGAVNDIPVDIRILVATNRDLETAIAEGKFREDLYHRLNEFSITVPPLRERRADIPMFAAHFLAEANVELEKSLTGFSDEALSVLKEYHWSGNLRELRNAVRRAALFAQGDTVEAANLPVSVCDQAAETDLALRPDNEPEMIRKALQIARGNKALAARLLKIDRKTLYNKMHLYGMDI